VGGVIWVLALLVVGIVILYSIIKAAIENSEMIRQMKKMNRKMDDMTKLLVQLQAQNGGGTSGGGTEVAALERFDPCPACGDAAPVQASVCPSCGITLISEPPPNRRNGDE